MSSARDEILAKVSAVTADPNLPDDVENAFFALVDNSSTRTSHKCLRSFSNVVEEFVTRAQEVDAEVVYCEDIDTTKRKLRDLVGSDVMYATSVVAEMLTDFSVSHDSRCGSTYAVVSAEAGIAETGTVAVNSRIARSDALYLFDHLVLLLDAKNIVARFEEYWQYFRSANKFTRAVHMISGPSRTADVEQIIQLGAHGPRRLTVIVVGSSK